MKMSGLCARFAFSKLGLNLQGLNFILQFTCVEMRWKRFENRNTAEHWGWNDSAAVVSHW